jgi:glutamate decarboxylase
MEALAGTATWIAGELAKRSDLVILAGGADLPVVCFGLAGKPGFSVFDLSAVLRQRGWIVPAYKMAPDADEVEVLRVVVREGLSRDLASELVYDIGTAIDQLQAGHHADQPAAPAATPAPGHRKGAARVATPRAAKKTRAVC